MQIPVSQADASHPNPIIAEKLARIYGLHRVEMDFRLHRSPYSTLLERLGNPHLHLPPTIHIAGTNGKGSTLAFCRSILAAAGYSAHTYTSPHLITFNERIGLAGQNITDDVLSSLLDEVWAVTNDLSLTFFEVTTALAFLAMSRTPADFTLLEVGLGGRLDCTNIIENPAATIITRISFDHMEYLGDTLPKIAAEKAGIMKPNMPCIIAPQTAYSEIAPVFIDIAKQMNAPLFMAGRDWALSTQADGFDLNGTHYPKPNLHGEHQYQNAATAIMALSHIPSLTLTHDQIVSGLQSAAWPARLEKLPHPTKDIWFDAAHNDSGAQSLTDWLATRKSANPNQTIHLIAAMGADKDASAFFDSLGGVVNAITLVDLGIARKPQTAADLLHKINPTLRAKTTCSTNVSTALKTIPDNTLVIIAGSLYLYQQCQTL